MNRCGLYQKTSPLTTTKKITKGLDHDTFRTVTSVRRNHHLDSHSAIGQTASTPPRSLSTPMTSSLVTATGTLVSTSLTKSQSAQRRCTTNTHKLWYSNNNSSYLVEQREETQTQNLSNARQR